MARHHLSGDTRSSLVSVCGDVGGIQAQVMSAAELALWTRRRSTRREDVRAALWQRRDLVKTTSLRMTLHLIPAGDFQMYIAAMKASSMASVYRTLKRIGAGPAHVDTMVAVIMDALADGPKTQQDLLARAKVRAARGMRIWLKHAWSAMRPAILEGLICYGPPRGAEATFVRVDQWLPKQRVPDELDARIELATRFLTAFGPATHRDFSKWSGLKTGDTRPVFDRLAGRIEPVTVDGAESFILRRDRDELADVSLDREPRLLPSFDTFLLAHAAKDHMVAPSFYKRVYRNQGWLSPVVLVGGRIVAIWLLEQRAKAFTLDVRPFEALSSRLRAGLEREAEALGYFLGARCEVRILET
jgi:DNA glycosylase AlkZ-like